MSVWVNQFLWFFFVKLEKIRKFNQPDEPISLSFTRFPIWWSVKFFFLNTLFVSITKFYFSNYITLLVWVCYDFITMPLFHCNVAQQSTSKQRTQMNMLTFNTNSNVELNCVKMEQIRLEAPIFLSNNSDIQHCVFLQWHTNKDIKQHDKCINPRQITHFSKKLN